MDQPTTAKPKKRSKVFAIVLALLVIAGALFAFVKIKHGKKHAETDDAQVEANISPVIPRVSGYVKDVMVKDNQYIKKGDTLMVLDDRDFNLRVEQAESALGTAKSNLLSAEATTHASKAGVTSTHAGVSTIDAQIEAAKVALWRASQDYDRYSNLIKDHSITQQQFEQADAAKQTAQHQLEILQQQKNQLEQQTNTVSAQSNATASQISVAESIIRQRQVEVDEAKLNLSYTVITAQESGTVSKINIQPGQFVQAGQSLFSIVINNNVWVVANFKETQFGKIRIGQAVTIKADAFPKHSFAGIVTSFSPATGSRFALLPPDNATGNFVKVVQRLPVKIDFSDPNDPYLKQLVDGMNVVADVHIK
jgi:membrane fusion protein, multidrug efflux system